MESCSGKQHSIIANQHQQWVYRKFLSTDVLVKMTPGLTINKTINIAAGKSKVWEALTNPKFIKQYLPGADVKSDWKVGSKIIYSGIFNGIKFKDEGEINILDFEKQFQYSYWSANHGTVNIPKNHVIISYTITATNGGTKLELTQSNYKSKEVAEEMNPIWDLILGNLKKLVETK